MSLEAVFWLTEMVAEMEMSLKVILEEGVAEDKDASTLNSAILYLWKDVSAKDWSAISIRCN